MTKSSDNKQQTAQNSSYSDTLAKIDRISEIDKEIVKVSQQARGQLQQELFTLESNGKDGLDYRAELENIIKQMETTIVKSNGEVSKGDYDKVAGELQRIYTRDEKNGIDPGIKPEEYERLTEAVDMISTHKGIISQVDEILRLEEATTKLEDAIKKVAPTRGRYNDMEYREQGHEQQHNQLTAQLNEKQDSLQKYRNKLSQGELRKTISEMRTPIMIRNPQNSQMDYQRVMEELQKKGGTLNTEDFSYPTLITAQQEESYKHTKQQYVNNLKTKFQAVLKSANPEARDINWKDDACKELIKGFEKIYDINETYPEERDYTRTMDAPNTRSAVKQISIATMATLDIMKQYSVDADKAYDHVHQLLKKSVINFEIKEALSNEISDIIDIKKMQDSVAATIKGIEALTGKDHEQLIKDMGSDAQAFKDIIHEISAIHNKVHSPRDQGRGLKEELGVGIAGDVRLNNQSLEFKLTQLNSWCEEKLKETNKSVFKKVGQVVSDAASLVSHYITSGFKPSVENLKKAEALKANFNDSLQSCLEPKGKAAALAKISENVKTWGDKIKANQVTLDSPQSHSSSSNTRTNSSGKGDGIGRR